MKIALIAHDKKKNDMINLAINSPAILGTNAILPGI